jgi:transcription-repair coupling factor (superfamily II helicase)
MFDLFPYGGDIMSIFESLFNHSGKNNIGVIGLNEELNAIYIHSFFQKQNDDVIVVTNSLFEANRIYESLLTYTENVFFFPADDFLTSVAIAMSPDLKMIRLETLNKIIKLDKKIIVTHLMGFLKYLPTKKLWLESIVNLTINDEIDINKLVDKLYNIGYVRETIVGKTGELAVRGFVLDVYPVNEKMPIRIEFFGNIIESIRYFDVDNQRSLENINNIEIYPCDEYIVEGEIDDTISRQEHFHSNASKLSSIKEYLNNPTIIYKDYNQIKSAYTILLEEMHNYNLDKKIDPKKMYVNDLYQINADKNIYLMVVDNIISNIAIDILERYTTKETPDLRGDFNKLNEYLIDLIKKNKTIIIALPNRIKIKDLTKYLEIEYIITKETNIIDNKINIIEKDVNSGFEIDNLVVITKKELFGVRKTSLKTRTNFKYSTKIKDINKINIGDYVVHDTHGIGIYMGVTTLTILGLKKDYLLIKYRGNDKLYIPVEKIDLISKYAGSESVVPKINKLGGTEWQKAKLRIKAKIKDIANRLLKIAAERELATGFQFDKDTSEQKVFENNFIYEETDDQIKATEAIKRDMEKKRPMDRLLCGDVGYGKTEVAFRAMFKAVSNSKQVAYLCPTTILSKQQYESALERFSGFPINIALLNRFVTPKKVKEIMQGLETGRIDIVFGTHKLLNDKIKFKNLGLLIIDEEQRFGVIQKEKIKEYKATVDVLTLSATPIPRTLQMSLIGLRDLSLIETPPMNRHPIQTYVLPINNEIIKQAIYRELSRNGQVFILYNRIDSMERKAEEIKKLVPDAKITYAHGQMPKIELEDRMLSFINKEYDVLLCSTIIETGIDIPNVNTLIVIDADRYGLSQLYQIRGRVGRSDRIAYAYLMYDERKVLNESAVKRLSAIKEFTELGSGFAIASRDLSIRGAGDLLGKEQAGFIDTIGIELYIRMLNEEVARLKGELIMEVPREMAEKPLINVETHIDDSYVKEEELKIEIHKRINEIDSYQSLLAIKDELEDRFGTVSNELEIYMYQEWFEQLVKKVHVISVSQTEKNIEIIFGPELLQRIRGDTLFEIAYNIADIFQFKYKRERLSMRLDFTKLKKHYIYYLTEFFQAIITYLSHKDKV